MTTPRLYLFDPNLKSSAGHYLGYAMRVARAAEALGVPSVIVGNTCAPPDLPGTRILAELDLDYWQEMCPAAGEDPHDHLSDSAERFAQSLSRIQNDEGLRDNDAHPVESCCAGHL